MAQQELWCKLGKHFYTREATRGRKPIACDEHRNAVSQLAERETLTCKRGHSWTRPSGSKGRKPEYCPDHAPTPRVPAAARTQRQSSTSASSTETLFCEAGQHEWQRPATRGKKPKNCPDHLPLVRAAVLETARITKAKEAAKRAREAVQAEREAAEREYATIGEQVRRAYDHYDELFKRAMRVPQDDAQLWQRVNQAQVAAINTSARQRALGAQLRAA